MTLSHPREIAPLLLDWYDRHRRDLPWRSGPGLPADPYRVWLSEVMLQQTTVATVGPYFARFLARWPTVKALAAAPLDDVLAEWAGLGYYARARNLHACARAVAEVHGGVFPDTEDGLRDLPGIGAYTAAAVAAIAFDRVATVVDGNVERVVARLFAVEEPMPGAKPRLKELAATLTPNRRPGDFAQAMMDLGATICTPRSPACAICPLRQDCAAFATADPAAFPVKAAKKAKPHRLGHGWWIERDGHVWLVRRPDKGLLGGMRALPSSDWSTAPDPTPPVAADWTRVAQPVGHVFTHFSLALSMNHAHVEAHATPHGEGEWWPVDSLGEAGLPTLFVRAAEAVRKDQDARNAKG